MVKDISLELQEGGANYRVKWQCYFSILRAPGALMTENTVILFIINVAHKKGKEYHFFQSHLTSWAFPNKRRQTKRSLLL